MLILLKLLLMCAECFYLLFTLLNGLLLFLCLSLLLVGALIYFINHFPQGYRIDG
jgi:hypothetical protein